MTQFSEHRGERNAYYCQTCRGLTLVKLVDSGVTPMFLACRRAGLDPNENPCKGTAASLMYPPERFFKLLDPLVAERNGVGVSFGHVEQWDWEFYAANKEQREGNEALSLRKRAQS